MDWTELAMSASAWIWALFGLLVGSFLNVCIHRLPIEGMGVACPRRSLCPCCGTTLSWRENIPLLSWIFQRGKCIHCKASIRVRYPIVEAANAALWYTAVRVAGPEHVATWLIWSTVLSGLLVATMVDFDCFQIPDEVSLGGCVLAPLAALFIPSLHDASWVAQQVSSGGGLAVGPGGALLSCVAGMLTGAGILLLIGWLGKWVYGVEAMGLGDVKLLAAGGGFVGPAGSLGALAVAALLASVFGLLNMVRFFVLSRRRAGQRGRLDSVGRSMRIARLAGRYLPFGPFLGVGIGIALLAWDDLSQLWP